MFGNLIFARKVSNNQEYSTFTYRWAGCQEPKPILTCINIIYDKSYHNSAGYIEYCHSDQFTSKRPNLDCNSAFLGLVDSNGYPCNSFPLASNQRWYLCLAVRQDDRVNYYPLEYFMGEFSFVDANPNQLTGVYFEVPTGEVLITNHKSAGDYLYVNQVKLINLLSNKYPCVEILFSPYDPIPPQDFLCPQVMPKIELNRSSQAQTELKSDLTFVSDSKSSSDAE